MAYNVLIVDDSKSMRKVIRKALAAAGFQVGKCIEAGNGREALDMLADNWVDLILSDIHMPVMDGIEFIRNLRKEENWQNLPVVYITTESNETRLDEVMALGAKGYLHKPFKPEAIRTLLAAVMGETDEAGVAPDDDGCDF